MDEHSLPIDHQCPVWPVIVADQKDGPPPPRNPPLPFLAALEPGELCSSLSGHSGCLSPAAQASIPAELQGKVHRDLGVRLTMAWLHSSFRAREA